MGLFDFKKKGMQIKSENTSSVSNEKTFIIENIQKDVTQRVAMCMVKMKITKTPLLKFFYNDNGVFEGFFLSHIDDPQYQIIKKLYGDDMYLSMMGCHAFGTGVYATLCQAKYKKPIVEWSIDESREFSKTLSETDPYELALKSLGFSTDSKNKKCLDHIVQVGGLAYISSCAITDSNKFDREYLKAFMKVMYNAGITLIMRK